MIRLSNTTPIRDLRIALKMSQGAFAKAIGVDQANVSAMERRLPTMRTLARVLAKLGLEPVIMAGTPVEHHQAEARAGVEVVVNCGHQAGKTTRFQAEARTQLLDDVEALRLREAELQSRLAKLRAGQ